MGKREFRVEIAGRGLGVTGLAATGSLVRMSAVIATARLDLVPLDADLLAGSLEGRRAAVEAALGARLPEIWPDHEDVFRMRLEQLREDVRQLPWLLRALVLRETREVVGHAGFHTPPGAEYLQPYSPGAVEFGFTVVPKFRRRGLAREAGEGLMRWAASEQGVRAFVLSIRPDNVPSQALARSWGFTKIGGHVDEIDGPEDILELKVVPGREPWRRGR